QDLHKVAGCSVNGLIADECHVVSLDAIRLDKRLASRNRYSKSGCSIASFALFEYANCTLVAALRNSATWPRPLPCEPHLWPRRDADRPTGLSRSSATNYRHRKIEPASTRQTLQITSLVPLCIHTRASLPRSCRATYATPECRASRWAHPRSRGRV